MLTHTLNDAAFDHVDFSALPPFPEPEDLLDLAIPANRDLYVKLLTEKGQLGRAEAMLDQIDSRSDR